jgi:hypothetical protein
MALNERILPTEEGGDIARAGDTQGDFKNSRSYNYFGNMAS